MQMHSTPQDAKLPVLSSVWLSALYPSLCLCLRHRSHHWWSKDADRWPLAKEATVWFGAALKAPRLAFIIHFQASNPTPELPADSLNIHHTDSKGALPYT